MPCLKIITQVITMIYEEISHQRVCAFVLSSRH